MIPGNMGTTKSCLKDTTASPTWITSSDFRWISSMKIKTVHQKKQFETKNLIPSSPTSLASLSTHPPMSTPSHICFKFPHHHHHPRHRHRHHHSCCNHHQYHQHPSTSINIHQHQLQQKRHHKHVVTMTCSFLPAIGIFMSKRHYRHRKTSRNMVGLIMLIVFSVMLGSMYHRSYSFGIFCTSCFILIDVLRCLDPFCPATCPATHMCFVFCRSAFTLAQVQYVLIKPDLLLIQLSLGKYWKHGAAR